MTVRFFVTSAALIIFSWLATTYLRVVPMDTYPVAPVEAHASSEESTLVLASSVDEPPEVVISHSSSSR